MIVDVSQWNFKFRIEKVNLFVQSRSNTHSIEKLRDTNEKSDRIIIKHRDRHKEKSNENLKRHPQYRLAKRILKYTQLYLI